MYININLVEFKAAYSIEMILCRMSARESKF